MTPSSLQATDAQARLDELVAEHVPRHALQRAFHTDPGVYALELDRIWRRSWLFAGHSCQVRDPGDYLTFDVDADSLAVVRGEDGVLRAFHNTCRHRGMRVCPAPTGSAGKRLVCPYHQWSYGLDGRLLACGGMDRDGDLDRADYGLLPVHVEEVAGLVFVFVGDEPTPFDEVRAAYAAHLAPQGLDRAKVAAVRDYEIEANWKLVWENNRECWHCHLGHPEYIQANFDAAAVDNPRVKARVDELAQALSDRLREHGLEIDYREPGLIPFPTPDRWWSINRTPLVEGWVTESLDGQPVAPPMGDYPDPEVGTLRLRTVPNFWNHSSGDHAMSTRLAPAGTGATRVQIQWLVHEDAVEGRDYDLDRLLPFWQRTSEQDWELCEANQRGVLDSAFLPGPYSSKREYNVIAFMEWYLERIAAGG